MTVRLQCQSGTDKDSREPWNVALDVLYTFHWESAKANRILKLVVEIPVLNSCTATMRA